MIVRKLEIDLYSVLNSVFFEFVANSGGALSINHSEVCFESISSSYFSCTATGYDFYYREKISGGAIAFYGKSSYHKGNCFESCQGPKIGSTVYEMCIKNNISHIMNTYFKNFDGNGILTFDGLHPINLKENNFSHSSSLSNTAISASIPATDSIRHNNFACLISTEKSYYVWTNYDITFLECNFVEFGDTKISVFRVASRVTLQSCVLWDIPAVLSEAGGSFSALNTISDDKKYIGTVLINSITVTSNLVTHKISGKFQCNMKTCKCMKNFRGLVALSFLAILEHLSK